MSKTLFKDRITEILNTSIGHCTIGINLMFAVNVYVISTLLLKNRNFHPMSMQQKFSSENPVNTSQLRSQQPVSSVGRASDYQGSLG